MGNVIRGTLFTTLLLALGLSGIGCGGADTAPKDKAPPKIDMEKKKEEMMKTREKMGGKPVGPGGEAEEKDKSKDKEKE